jgi:hypothetical protein
MLKIIDNQITYPYSIRQLRRDNPQVSFPRDIPDERLADWGVYRVAKVAHPVYDPETQALEEGQPVQIDGVWTQVWNVRSLTTEELKSRVPQSITKRQARQELIESGFIGAVEAAIDAIQDPTQKALMLSWWNDSQDYERANPELITMAASIGLTEEQLDAMFLSASKR